MAFIDLAKGMLDWHEKYNSDFRQVHTQLLEKANIGRIPMYPIESIPNVTESSTMYGKTPFEMVTLRVNTVIKDNVSGSNATIIGVLPEGFRSNYWLQTPIIVYTNMYRYVGAMTIDVTGIISVSCVPHDITECKTKVYGMCTFNCK